jgi:4-hydroxy-3-polyprenylbenzoate decarboxylase
MSAAGPSPSRLIVAMTGASGSALAVRVLQLLQDTPVETHLVISPWAARTLVHETSFTVKQVQELAGEVYPAADQGAAIAHGFGDNLIHRAADVVLKERRRLVLAVRETPLSEIHLENLLKLSRLGVVIAPPVPAFYTRPECVDDIISHTALRLLDQFGIHLGETSRWGGEWGAGAAQRKMKV